MGIHSGEARTLGVAKNQQIVLLEDHGPWANPQGIVLLESASSDPWRAQGPMAPPPALGGENTAARVNFVVNLLVDLLTI